MKKFYKLIFFVIFSLIFLYFGLSFYLANTILKMNHTCGDSSGFSPNTWKVLADHNMKSESRINLRNNFEESKYYLDKWESVNFKSRGEDINISGWLFNYHINQPVVIVVHGIFPNGKCKFESNLIASLLIKNSINVLTIDLRNYGESDIVSNYENLGLTSYRDVLGAYDYLRENGYSQNQIGLIGLSLGASTVIIASKYEDSIKAIWSESSLAKFNMILTEEIGRYGFPNIFGFGVKIVGSLLSGVDPNNLNPVYYLNANSNYFFTHGDDDERVYVNHFYYFKKYAESKNISAEFWLIKNSGHIDGLIKNPELYGKKMKDFFKKNLK
ncbi:MAG: hypothetical protein CFH19_00038 [Alphaproteobacteria bacterium MarineAlpha5_Bin9]|nr:MAG: hypothetical protein CFH19_00038 [Alphaproteobacteria bacterium MarineAlpha5_Bin9]|tara:strand:+ start:1208 stop:2191 length:984 start_codon:yes stop_codon:yes gene_type:complete